MSKKLIKNKILVLSLLLITIVSFNGCKKVTDISNLDTTYVHPIYIIDMSKPEEVVGLATNVFIGYIEEIIDTSYDWSIPYTHYNVKVINNIKGELPVDSIIKINKEGGISKDLSHYILHENDSLPNVNEYYVFNVIETEDNSYVASGINMIVPIDEINIDSIDKVVNRDSSDIIEKNIDIKEELEDSNIYNKYLDAFSNQIEYDPNR
ncbi:MAG: putative rane protein [Anaerocolumna sp.]|nr:putative rane protein [Anaerocolumna sp.]